MEITVLHLSFLFKSYTTDDISIVAEALVFTIYVSKDDCVHLLATILNLFKASTYAQI